MFATFKAIMQTISEIYFSKNDKSIKICWKPFRIMIFCRVSRTTSKSINEKSIVNLTAWKSEIGFQSHKPILFYSRPKQLLHTTLESKVTYLWHKNFIAKITDLLTVFSEAILWRIGVSLAFGSHKFRLIFALI